MRRRRTPGGGALRAESETRGRRDAMATTTTARANAIVELLRVWNGRCEGVGDVVHEGNDAVFWV